MCVCCVLSHFSHVWFSATLWTVSRQAFLSMGFSRQVYYSGLLHSPPGVFQTHISNPCFYVSCIGRWVLYHLHHLGNPRSNVGSLILFLRKMALFYMNTRHLEFCLCIEKSARNKLLEPEEILATIFSLHRVFCLFFTWLKSQTIR